MEGLGALFATKGGQERQGRGGGAPLAVQIGYKYLG